MQKKEIFKSTLPISTDRELIRSIFTGDRAYGMLERFLGMIGSFIFFIFVMPITHDLLMVLLQSLLALLIILLAIFVKMNADKWYRYSFFTLKETVSKQTLNRVAFSVFPDVIAGALRGKKVKLDKISPYEFDNKIYHYSVYVQKVFQIYSTIFMTLALVVLGLSYFAKVSLYGEQGFYSIVGSVIFFGIIGVIAPAFAYFFGVKSTEDSASNVFQVEPEEIVLTEEEVNKFTAPENEGSLYWSAEYYLYKDVAGLKSAGYKAFLSIVFLVAYNLYRADIIVAAISTIAIFAIHFTKMLYLLVFVREYPSTFMFMNKKIKQKLLTPTSFPLAVGGAFSVVFNQYIIITIYILF